jgi:hypothetical protein
MLGKICDNVNKNYDRNLDSSVGIATGWKARVQIPVGEIFLFSIASRLVMRPTHPAIQWVSGVIPSEVVRQVREAGHSPPSSAQVKNGEVIVPLRNMSSWHST